MKNESGLLMGVLIALTSAQGPLSLASSASPGCSPDETKGIFCDERAEIKISASLPGCDSAIWKEGFFEGLSGATYLEDQSKMLSAEKRACRRFKNNPSLSDQLHCCEQAFLDGHEQLDKIVNGLIVVSDPNSSLGQCASKNIQGREFADQYCHNSLAKNPAETVCPQKLEDQTGAGCFSIGYSKRIQRCNSSDELLNKLAIFDKGGDNKNFTPIGATDAAAQTQSENAK